MMKKLQLLVLLLGGATHWQATAVTQQGLINTSIELEFTVGIATCVAGGTSSNNCPVTITEQGKNAIAGTAPAFRLNLKSSLARARLTDLGKIAEEKQMGIQFPKKMDDWKLYSFTDAAGNKLYFVLVRKAKETLLYSATEGRDKWVYQGNFPNVPVGLNFALKPAGTIEVIDRSGKPISEKTGPIVFDLTAQEDRA